MRKDLTGNNLVILTPGFASSEDDKNCLPAQQALVLSIKKYYPNIKQTILSFEYPFSKKPYKWNGINVIPFGGNHKGGLFRLFRWLRIWQTLRKLQKQEPITGLISFWAGQCALVGNYYAMGAKIPHVNWILGQDAKKGNRYPRLMPIHSRNFMAISDFVAKTFQDNYGVRPGLVLPNAILPDLFVLKEQNRSIDIIGVGSLIALKKFDLFIQIISQLKDTKSGLTVIICGEGPEKQSLQDLIDSNGLSDTITLLGEKPHPEVFDLMQRSKILLHTSEYEGFSGVCLEALYAGAHVVSFHQPMEGWIRHWHIVDNQTEAFEMLNNLLRQNILDHSSSLPYHMKDTADKLVSFLVD